MMEEVINKNKGTSYIAITDLIKSRTNSKKKQQTRRKNKLYPRPYKTI